MNPPTRREFLKTSGSGLGYLALAGLTAEAATAGYQSPLAPKLSHHAPKAKRVIMMFMQGAPAQMETFDHSPEMEKAEGVPVSAGAAKNAGSTVLAPVYKFRPYGQSGQMISEIFPNVGAYADDLCILNGMYTDNPAHPQATIMWHTGSINFVRPSMGSWVVYGLGTENESLPGFITINPPANLGGAQNYGSGFLPASFQGTKINTQAKGIPNLSGQLSRGEQRRHLNLVQSMNRNYLRYSRGNDEIEGVIESYELAFRMQTTVPEVMDFSKESRSTLGAYGIGNPTTDKFGRQCLMARRLAEAGVRFIEVAHPGWDQHNALRKRLQANAYGTDQPIAALLGDLKQRGLFEDTLLIWGGEFGRTPMRQGNDGRRHNNRGFTMWLAGAGIKGGIRHGKSDPISGIAVEGKVHTHDMHATILHLLGLDHERLTFKYAGRDFRLTDVAGEVVSEVLA
jgi:hypothetical protein